MQYPLTSPCPWSLRIFAIILQLLLINNLVLAAGEDWSQKVEKKTAQRWTLQEWLAQKERNGWMDQWLILHTPSPYEFALEVTSINSQVISQTDRPTYQYYNGGFTAYATLVGLEFQNSNNASEGLIDNTGLFLLRLFGAADQGSHLTLGFGQKRRHNNNLGLPWRSQYLGQVDLTLYLNQHFGIKAWHREFSPIEGDTTFGTVSGHEQSFSVFIDFAALRLFGGWMWETEKQTKANLVTMRNLSGLQAGLRLYF